MIGEVPIAGVFVPLLLLSGMIAAALAAGLRTILVRTPVRRWFWHPALADLCLFVVLWALATRWVSQALLSP
jgi:hypothetical protein